MSSFAPATGSSVTQHIEEPAEWFPGVKKIEYVPNAGAKESLVFRQYNASEVILGKTMAEWLRFGVCYWHTFRGTGADPFGAPTFRRPWEDGSDSVENAKRRLRAAFEFMHKLGAPYWTFHDRDIAPEGKTIQETNKNLDEVVALAKELQQKTGIKLLWGTANLFSHPRYMNGASTNPDALVFARAAAQVKKAMEVTKELGGVGYVFWGGREGYQSILNTDLRRELDHMGRFLKLAADYKKKIGFDGQLLIEPKPKEPTKHQYDYDAQSVIGFLHHYGLDKDFKLNIEPNHTTLAGHSYEHDVAISARFGMLGSIDANTGDQSLGWDTDQFPSNIRDTTLVMLEVLKLGGLTHGGLNFDCKVRRESTELEDLFIAHIGAMDAFAAGLRKAAAIVQEKVLSDLISQRYSTYDSGIGADIESGKAGFEELEKYVTESNSAEPQQQSGKQERYEQLFNHYLTKQ